MADILTINKALAQQVVGSNNNTWGSDLNSTLGVIDNAFGGETAINVTGVASGAYALTLPQYQPPNIFFDGAMSGGLLYLIPAGVGGIWTIANFTSGAFNLEISVGTGSTGVLILPHGYRSLVVSDGNTVSWANLAGQTVTVTAAKLTGGGTQGSLTFVNGVLISSVQAT